MCNKSGAEECKGYDGWMDGWILTVDSLPIRGPDLMVVQYIAQHVTLRSTAQHACGLDTQCHNRYSTYT